MKNLNVIFSVALFVALLNGIFFSLNPNVSLSGEANKLSVIKENSEIKVENTSDNSILVKCFDLSGNLNWEKEIIYKNNNTAKNVNVENKEIKIDFISSDASGYEVNGEIIYDLTGNLKKIDVN
ncbi:MAG TPA: hypothetical protein DIS94_10630 [Bacteroidetes bacterium]|nr:hypothetical protein [Bacteroidota bacterium]